MSDLQADVQQNIFNILRWRNSISTHCGEILCCLRTLRNLCARGPHVQQQIALDDDFQQLLSKLLFDADVENGIEQLQITGWQLLANMTVSNQQTQILTWKIYGERILDNLVKSNNLGRKVDIMLMIIYNSIKSPSAESLVDIFHVLRAILCVWFNITEQKNSDQFDFLHFLFEEYLVRNGRNTIKCYARLSTDEILSFLDYVNNYIRQENPNGLIHNFILQHISKEFKIKSDFILRVVTLQEVDKMKPKEAYALLRVIASASGSESYAELYSTDHSLFLNVSSLLRCLVAASKNSENTILCPMNKLEEVALASNVPADYQSEISFELKTLLVRCIANLLYKNEINKGYCLDTQLLPSLFECTNMDARNPLMKEWSILAIRNACIGCPEVQQVIAEMTEKGPAKNEILTELNLDMGSLRINSLE